MADTIYEPTYTNSWALVVGINKYQSASPLSYACNDAEGFAEVIKTNFDFPEDNVILLTDDSATREKILQEFLAFANGKTEPNDRLIFFFAGHGHTQTGNRGDIGFLVPVDGQVDDLASLVRWDELTRNAELIPAKHVLFIMDACYGGLAVTRRLAPGSMRFAKDMLQRYTRQVLTAGKADEIVSDAGGPRPDHSVFTGHLLDSLDGNAAFQDGILTANRTMAYVYERVATDYQSHQTPHYGLLDGDGDMIFNMSPIDDLKPEDGTPEDGTDQDILIGVPATSEPLVETEMPESLEDQLKELLSEPKNAIKLHDLVAAEVRRVLSQIGDDSFPVQSGENIEDEFAERLKRYEELIRDLITVVVLLARWAGPDQRNILETVFARLPDPHKEMSGLTSWLGMRWYPVMLLIYTAGIAALSVGNYENLATVLTTKVGSRRSGDKSQPVIIPTVEGILDVDRAEMFKRLPGYEKNYVPRSEYLFKMIQPLLEDLLFLGTSYESLFDRFEVFYALVVVDCTYEKDRDYVWGPPGRFGWKFKRDGGPFNEVLVEAKENQKNWAPLHAGLFHGSYDRFIDIAEKYQTDMLEKLPWW